MHLVNRLTVVVAAALAAATPTRARATVTVQGTELPPYQAVTNQLGVGYGAVFSSLNLPYVTFTEIVPTIWGIQGCEPFASPLGGYSWYNAPIFVNFVDPADGVTPATVSGTITAMWGDAGGDLDGVDMRAYDASNNLVTSGTFTGISLTQIQVTGVGIRRVEFWANTVVGGPNSDTGLDWITYPTPSVPGPFTGVGLAALVGAAACGRRRRACIH